MSLLGGALREIFADKFVIILIIRSLPLASFSQMCTALHHASIPYGVMELNGRQILIITKRVIDLLGDM